MFVLMHHSLSRKKGPNDNSLRRGGYKKGKEKKEKKIEEKEVGDVGPNMETVL